MDGDQTGLLQQLPGVQRHRLDVGQYYRMAEVGILQPRDRVELIEGEIIDMAPIGSEHSGVLSALGQDLMLAAGRRVMCVLQGPLRLSDHDEPQPDLLVLKPRADRYRGAHPTPADVLLLVEVAASSLAYDRKVKLPLYARHGVPEVWIVNLDAKVVERYRTPQGDAYQDGSTLARDATIEPAALPGVRLELKDILG